MILKMKELIIFGTGKIADVIHYYATHECNRKVVAFTVDSEYIKTATYHNCPVIPFDEVVQKFPPEQFEMFVAVGFTDLNRPRQIKCKNAKEKGYKLTSIVSPNTNLPKTVSFGENCFIMPPAIIHPYVNIGDNTFVFSGAMIGHHSKIGDHCWITSSANIAGEVQVGDNCFLAMNATITHSLRIGNECFLGANALVTKNLNDKSVVIAESSKLFRLKSNEFLRFASFSNF